jgi:endonuclease YncB( thermonuclease family)
VIEVGFGIKVYDKLRLRGIDTPELGTPEGERAKKFVLGLLPPGATIIIKSHKTRVDLHGRFVVDVFYRGGATTAEAVLQEPVYLNQKLIDENLAVRMAE